MDNSTLVPFLWGHAELARIEPMHKLSTKTLFPELGDCINFVPLYNDTDYAYIAEFDHAVVMSFRGTKNIRAWKENTDIYPLTKGELDHAIGLVKNNGVSPYDASEKVGLLKSGPWGGGCIANNTYEAWSYFKQAVDDYLKGGTRDKDWYFTGHSRGGAIAPLAARHLAKNRRKECQCVSFGAPRIGTIGFKMQMASLPLKYVNVHHGYEFTESLPPKILGFVHAGNRIWLKEPWFHRFFYRIRDHFYSTTTKALIKKYPEASNLKIVKTRANP